MKGEVFISQLFSPKLLEEMLEEGMVLRSEHPSAPLLIYNYTAKAQFRRRWNEVTVQCRGLIVHKETGVVVARPFVKFFNLGEIPERAVPKGEAVVLEKVDGSLAILFEYQGELAMATRGSFVSEQALHATEIYKERYEKEHERDASLTYLFEIIYPANRIVLDYGELDDLVLLGAVQRRSGRSVAPEVAARGWSGPVVERLAYSSLKEVVELAPRPGKEGVVVWFPKEDVRIKVKESEYVRIHRILAGLTVKRVWEALASGNGTGEILQYAPEETHAWVKETARILQRERREVYEEIGAAMQRVEELVGKEATKKEFALAAVKEGELASFLFGLKEGKDIEPRVWEAVRKRQGGTGAIAEREDQEAAN